MTEMQFFPLAVEVVANG